jgi:hypothetical protein
MFFRVIALLLLLISTTIATVAQGSISPVDLTLEKTNQSLPISLDNSTAPMLDTSELLAAAPGNYAGRALTATEQTRLEKFLRSKNISTTSPNSPPGNPRFILHDTAVILPPERLAQEQREGRGPLGLGVSIYAPRGSNAILARPNFYELRRPTTTEFEKAADVLVQSQRESLFRRIWRSTNISGRQQATNQALSNLGLNASEIVAEQRKAITQLSSANGKIFTTGTWITEKICSIYDNGNRSIAANSDLGSVCGAVKSYFTVRNNRVGTSVPIEILQVGARSASGNQNSCNARNSNLTPFSRPPYTETQYDNVLLQYLRATLLAGKYPETTTHFALDAFSPDAHCDPRCFNLNKMYGSVATVMGHDRNSKYGVTPSYGTRLGTNNIWWDNRFCYSGPPSPN